MERLAGPLHGARVLDLGAGTGIASRALAERGARVLALDRSAPMLRRLRATSPLPAVVADGHALPVRDAAVDLVTGAQMWHWVDPAVAGAEVARVLRPGGAVAVWWNDSRAQDERWHAAGKGRLRAELADQAGHDEAPSLPGPTADVRDAEVAWTRRLPVGDYLVYLSSVSYVAELGEELPAFLDEQRAALTEAFPDGVVVEPMVARLWVSRPPARLPSRLSARP